MGSQMTYTHTYIHTDTHTHARTLETQQHTHQRLVRRHALQVGFAHDRGLHVRHPALFRFVCVCVRERGEGGESESCVGVSVCVRERERGGEGKRTNHTHPNGRRPDTDNQPTNHTSIHTCLEDGVEHQLLQFPHRLVGPYDHQAHAAGGGGAVVLWWCCDVVVEKGGWVCGGEEGGCIYTHNI